MLRENILLLFQGTFGECCHPENLCYTNAIAVFLLISSHCTAPCGSRVHRRFQSSDTPQHGHSMG